MTAQSLRLRTDLVISEQETPSGKIFVVKDAARSRFYRLREPEFRLAEQLDGATALETARRNVEARFAARISPDTLERFVARLTDLGLLEGVTRAEPDATRTTGRIRGSFLYLRVAAFDPDRYLERLARTFRSFLTARFVALSAGLVVLAAAITLDGWQEIARDIQQLYRLDAVLLAWITVLAVTAVHELAHGLVCKAFGGHVHEMGFLLIYLQPALYCNVSDAWLFPERAKRLWVTFAGAYVELVLWALATLIWRLTEVDSPLSYAALVVMATSGVKLTINLNPLIKLDGYYLLSDSLEIPNLRQRAFAYIRSRLRRAGPAPEVTAREARIYLGYGLLAGAYSFVLITLVTAALGSFLVARYQGLGFVVFATLVFLVLIRPTIRNRRSASSPERVTPSDHAPPRPSAPVCHADSAQARQASEARAWLDTLRRSAMDTAKTGPSQRHLIPAGTPRLEVAQRPGKEPVPLVPEGEPEPRRPWWDGRFTRRRLGWLAGAILAGLLLWFGHVGLTISGEFALLPVEHVEVRAEVDGIIEQVNVDEGVTIASGARIARLSDRDYRAQLRQLAAEVDEKRAQLKMLRAGPREEEISLARTALAKAVDRLGYARRHLDMLETDRNLVSRKEIDESREQVAVRQREIEEARERLEMLLAGNRPEEIEASEAELARLAAQQAHVEEQLGLLDVVSPIAGVVTSSKPRDKIGQHVRKGDLIVDVHALGTVTAEIAVSEKDIGEVRIGQPVLVKARAYPGKSFHGEVTSIAPVATREEGRPAATVVVVTRLDNPGLLLKPAMTGNAKIEAGDRRLLELVTRRFARYLRVEFWSWW